MQRFKCDYVNTGLKGHGYFDKVAESVGMGVTATQCGGRWKLVDPAIQDRKRGEWSEAEVRALLQ